MLALPMDLAIDQAFKDAIASAVRFKQVVNLLGVTRSR